MTSHDRQAKQPQCMYVFLASGEIDEIRPADQVLLTAVDLLVLYCGTEVASFKREQVLFASYSLVAPILF